MLAEGFGLAVAVVWRGYGGARWPHGDAARWVGADGSSVLLWHLPPDGYEFGRMLPTAEHAAASRWEQIVGVLAPRARAGVVLLTNGADHHALQPDLDVAIDSLRRAASVGGHSVQRSSLATWAHAFAAAAQACALPTVTGELRDSYGDTWTLQGTFATRAHQKRAVAQVDALLRHDVEPWVALAGMMHRERGAEHSRARSVGALTTTDLASLLGQTWRTFLRVLPHDTLCGCSVDEVARALDHRLEVVRTEAAALRDAALDVLLARDVVQSRSTLRDAWHPRLVLRNRSARQRHGVAEVEIVQTLRDVPVGPGSGGTPPDAVTLFTATVEGLSLQPLRQFRRYERRESPQHYPDNDLVTVTRALVWVPPERALGGFALQTRTLSESAHDDATQLAFSPTSVSKRGRVATLDNGLLRLRVGPRNIELHDLVTDRRIAQLVRLTWQADRGDTYTAAPRGIVSALKPVRARIISRGPLRVGVAVTYALRVPQHPFARFAHRDPFTLVRATIRFFVDAGAPFVRVHVAGYDAACDHRLRIGFATGLEQPQIFADAAFGPVLRVPLDRASVNETHEYVTNSAPLHRWVAAASERHSTTIISDGLAEYEHIDHQRLAITLVRATGALSRASLPERPGHAGWPAPVPQAQGPGRFSARFAIAPGGAFDAATAHELADDVLLPLIGYTWRDAPANAPTHVAGATLVGDHGVVASAVKPAENGVGMVLRCVNVHEAAHEAEWVVPWPDVTRTLARLDETPLVVEQGAPLSRLTLSKRAVSTLRVAQP